MDIHSILTALEKKNKLKKCQKVDIYILMYNLKEKKLEKFWVYDTSSFCNISESQRRFSRNV